ncbi:hypothetical protein [Flavobacterium quisquiliarum]|uniref:Lipoprotein n=1 Tax=Flavobacterium quisquiliarum TaxID=1834436 RepID=A0ABV8WDK2_9FLAO|nr:hypothetical protein [Flavobacterium quisquiliarum]MBW1658081.1 hypothetical protein [Flavobacterium quisquiliarum]NWK99852.1 hypothetical protein [Flavobacterium collinsii]
MNKLLIVLIFLTFGCSSNQQDIRSVELICYNWDLKYPTESFKGEFYIQPKLYSILNLEGDNQSYVCEFSPNKNEVYFHSKIDSKLLNDLLKFLPEIDENKALVHSYKQDGCMESSPMFRLKVVYFNNEEKYYQYYFKKSNNIDSAIKKLYVTLKVNQVEGKYEKMRDTLSFAKKKKAIIAFSMHTDTLLMPLPPLPKYNKVQFKK